MVSTSIPAERVRTLRDDPPNPEGSYVLYWMTAARRLRWNFALDRAVEWCLTLGRPLVILEGLRAAYPWASVRLHRFVMDGMAEKARAALPSGVLYFPYVERVPGEGRGLLEALAGEAAVVVGDDFPCFFLPRMVESAVEQCPARFELVDGNGVLPLRAVPRVYPSAAHFRRFVQREIVGHLATMPASAPLEGLGRFERPTLPEAVGNTWPRVTLDELSSPVFLEGLPVDSTVGPGAVAGGEGAATGALRRFLEDGLPRYAEDRNHPDLHAASGLSPYLHFGHLSSHEVFQAVTGAEGWTPLRLAADATGRREGWWGLRPGAEAFLDQLITWRELGFSEAAGNRHYDRYESLPQWALKTLDDHRLDPRPWSYEPSELETGETHDPVWNAAQRELLSTGLIHGYLRMLWGKKILEWSEEPEAALRVMVDLNNKYALDGRDPNSYSGIFWVLGRYDRPWPERAVYGKVRSMSSERTRRKVKMDEYLRTWGGG